MLDFWRKKVPAPPGLVFVKLFLPTMKITRCMGRRAGGRAGANINIQPWYYRTSLYSYLVIDVYFCIKMQIAVVGNYYPTHKTGIIQFIIERMCMHTAQRTRTRQLRPRARFTNDYISYIDLMYAFNSCSFNYKWDYSNVIVNA